MQRTIFHLRKELIHNDNEHDVRLIFLALLNMFKHRGHFLNASLSVEGNDRKICDIYKEFCIAVQEEVGVVFNEITDTACIEDVLANCYKWNQKKDTSTGKKINIKKLGKYRYFTITVPDIDGTDGVDLAPQIIYIRLK